MEQDAPAPEPATAGVDPLTALTWHQSCWRARAMVESPSHLRDHPAPLRLTLLAALLHVRERELTDTLVELLISTVHRIGADR